MAYQAWSVVAGEQPTTGKWNILGTNDAAFNNGTGFQTNVLPGNTLQNKGIGSTQLGASTGDSRMSQGVFGLAGGTWLDVPGCVTGSISPSANGFADVWGGGHFAGASAATDVGVRVWMSTDGGTYADPTGSTGGDGSYGFISSGVGNGFAAICYRVAISTGHSYVFKLQARSSNGVGNIVQSQGTYVHYQIIA